MDINKLEPTVFNLKPGQSAIYDGRVEISVNRSGQLEVDGKRDPHIVGFTYSSGPACSYHCFAVRIDGKVKVFPGDATGQGMIDEGALRKAFGF